MISFERPATRRTSTSTAFFHGRERCGFVVAQREVGACRREKGIESSGQTIGRPDLRDGCGVVGDFPPYLGYLLPLRQRVLCVRTNHGVGFEPCPGIGDPGHQAFGLLPAAERLLCCTQRVVRVDLVAGLRQNSEKAQAEIR
jgi:hypothetical protein